MPLPKFEFGNRKIILLSGYTVAKSSASTNETIQVVDRSKLEEAVEVHTNAVAFGYVRGTWLPSA